ncbi:OmpP1/FadL family transporter [Govanella unica]|uniref:Outer membrane protein transport protein n=1 Tax=Govanella unica TaxID=2975056 RepID=A0A9X3TZX2_9PROT|nr:porin [Govania unica]MDA5194542.1 outer membrane protein transport protein [Govania unica]
MGKKSASILKLGASLLLPCLVGLGGGAADAAGFYLGERSIKASGTGFAGAAALSDDASFMSFNPAILTGLKSAQITGGGYIIAPRAVVSNEGSFANIGPYTGLPLNGSARDQAFKPQPSGFLAAAMPITEDVWAGISVSAPFGLKNRYDEDYFGRYDSTQSSIMVIDIAPTLAWRVTDGLSIGGSLSMQRSGVTLVSAIPNPFDPAGPSAASDGSFRVHGTDWAYGYSLGLLFEPIDTVHLGVSYRGRVKHRLHGTATTTLFGQTTEQGVAADLNLPDVIAVAAAFDVTPRLTLLAQLNHYGWNRFKQIQLDLADGTTQVSPENYRNSLGGSVGAKYLANDRLTLRAGVNYDETPTLNNNRSTRVPDTNRWWLAVGLSYQLMDQLSVDVSYMHLLNKSGAINRTSSFPALATTINTIGSTDDSCNVFGLGLSHNF